MADWKQTKKTAILLGIAGIAIEIVAIAMLASKRLDSGIATPIIVGGMLLAFIPMFVVARHSRKR
jgi:hypothetical protein